MDYRESRQHRGNPEIILREIRSLLTVEGFRIERQSPDALVMTGPGMHSSRQNALLGMTRVDVRVSRSEVSFGAELGGVRFLRRFVMWFPPALGLGLTVVFLVVFSGRVVAWAPLAATAPWLVIGPFAGRAFERNTRKAIDTLLHNAVAIAETERP